MATLHAPDASGHPYSGELMFTQTWEDPACDLAALRPRPKETILAVTSGGDNVFGLLLSDPERIISVDINPAQTWLFELKRAAFRKLGHAEMLAFLGVTGTANSNRLYPRLRSDLSPNALAFWDGHRDFFDRGLLLQGKFERYFALLRWFLPFVLKRGALDHLFTLAPGEQRDFYARCWNTMRWRALLHVGCSRWMLGNRLDPSWFTQAETDSFGGHFARTAEHAIAELPSRSNYFLAQILLGHYVDGRAVPEYLRLANFETIRARLDRITPVTADIADAVEALAPRSVDCFALSNVFEYSPREVFRRTCTALARAARPGARFAHRNLLAPRRLADFAAFRVDSDLGERLRAADRGFIYSAFEAATLVEGSPA
jgi:S-adenosylmethionine-diacylglycerol 3-amino-3-carboxypropyl transferase